jgi:hypothetical protein
MAMTALEREFMAICFSESVAAHCAAAGCCLVWSDYCFP